MNNLEEQLRERTQVKYLMGAKIATIEEGRELVSEVDKFSKELINEMRENNLDNEATKAYSDVRYDLKTARHNLQGQMAKMVKEKHKH